MYRMYFLFLAIVGLAVILNIYFVTSNHKFGNDVAAAPWIQIMVTIPIFIVSAIVFFFMQNTDLGINYRNLFLLLPFILEICFFAYTKDLFSIFKADSGGFIIRSYVYSIGLGTIAIGLFNWILVKIF